MSEFNRSRANYLEILIVYMIVLKKIYINVMIFRLVFILINIPLREDS